jgi:hypothetical protein
MYARVISGVLRILGSLINLVVWYGLCHQFPVRLDLRLIIHRRITTVHPQR